MKYLLILPALMAFALTGYAQFDQYFESKTLRLDYFHCGKATEEHIYFDELVEEPFWAGSKINLIDQLAYGNHTVEVRTTSGELIFSRGFCTLFDEWQTTPESRQTECCYPESVVVPFPKDKVVVTINTRNKKGVFENKFEYKVDPKSYFIRKHQENLPVFDVVQSGNPEHKVDIVLLPEGYTENQRALFEKDCKQFAKEFFSYSPYSANRDNFNIRGVWAPSEESGTDIPGDHIWKNTRLNSSYYTFDSERYLMVDDFQGIREVAGNAPYDFVYVLANTEKYGGGAIYNFYGISAAHHVDETGKIYIHEFGHLFAGLGDEYVGGVEYNEFYPLDVEPWEPNLTTLVNFDQKWKSMLPTDAEIPTAVKDSNNKKLGVYEGGGYVTKGIYRPWINCLMNNLHSIDVFCPVCSQSIQKAIDFHCK